LPENDLELLERHLERVTLTPNHLELRLRQTVETAQANNPANNQDPANKDPITSLTANATTIAVAWTSPGLVAVKGIIHVPAHNTPMKPARREGLLMAIAKARSWLHEFSNARLSSFAVLARREGKAERHIRLLLPLAFLSPRIVSAVLDGTAPADLTMTALVCALPWSWPEQERRLGLPCDQTARSRLLT
jgi:site-specific DNA recombinase